jgi:excisionase family DNA binding protein
MILKNLQAGNAISIVPEHQQLTTQRAANILGVSRPFLVSLVEAGDIPFHMVGSHRRIYLRDLLDYKRRRDAARHQAINGMARAEMEAGTYDKVILPDGAEEE